jgi:hypothetical protein
MEHHTFQPGFMKRKPAFIILLLIIVSIVFGSCSRRYYSNHPGKVTKGYNKPPKKWKEPTLRYLKVKKKNKE